MIKRKLLVVLALGLACAMTGGMQAQDQKTDAPPTQNGGGQRPRGQRGGQDPVKRMTEALKLSEDQQAKLKTVFDEQRKKAQELRQDTSLSQEDRRKKAREMRDEVNGKVKGILTADQYAQWEKMRPQGRGQGQGQRQRRQTNDNKN